MNLGQAVAVCRYEIVRNPAAVKAAPEARREAKAGDLERITEMLGEILAQSGYVHERVEGSTELKLRRLIRRMKLTAHDAEVWLGILRQIRWKLLS
jgi:tRNA/rRNA methyltransferase